MLTFKDNNMDVDALLPPKSAGTFQYSAVGSHVCLNLTSDLGLHA